ncbi:MAG TPA: PAS-domain containing protein, partial [Roseococcus sp.]|nr:PAS-domain containing protein [Roseococcus sp.]
MSTALRPATEAARLVEALPMPLMAFGADDRLELSSRLMTDLLSLNGEVQAHGLSRGDALRRLAYLGLLGDGAPEARARALLDLDPATPQHRLLRATDRRVFEWRSVPLGNGGHAVMLGDCTSLIQGRDRVAAELQELQGILARLGTGVARFDAERRLRHGNPSYADMLGLSVTDVHRGISLEELLRRQEAQGEFDGGKRNAILAGFDAALGENRH